MTIISQRLISVHQAGNLELDRTPFMPGVAAGDASCSQDRPFTQTVDLDRFLGVLGTAGIETTAGTEESTQADLVKGNQVNDESGDHRRIPGAALFGRPIMRSCFGLLWIS